VIRASGHRLKERVGTASRFGSRFTKSLETPPRLAPQEGVDAAGDGFQVPATIDLSVLAQPGSGRDDGVGQHVRTRRRDVSSRERCRAAAFRATCASWFRGWG